MVEQPLGGRESKTKRSWHSVFFNTLLKRYWTSGFEKKKKKKSVHADTKQKKNYWSLIKPAVSLLEGELPQELKSTPLKLL